MKQTLLLMALAVSVAAIGSSCSGKPARERVAHVFGKDVSLSDLTPPEKEIRAFRLLHPKMSDEEILAQMKDSNLASMIWKPIREQFAKTHDVEPTDEEIQTFARAMDAVADDSTSESEKSLSALPDQMEREIYGSFVRKWKTSKALYEAYGGTVIFQQANPMEPVGAYRKLLTVHEERGDFKIFDEKLKHRFWEYYVRDHPFQIPPNEVDYSTPWWLKESSADAEK